MYEKVEGVAIAAVSAGVTIALQSADWQGRLAGVALAVVGLVLYVYAREKGTEFILSLLKR